MSDLPQIMALEPEDLDQAAQLVAGLDLYRSYGYRPDSVRALLQEALQDHRSTVLTARRGGQLLGLAWLVSRAGFDRSAYLRMLAVSAEEQGKGLGRRLVERLETRHLEPGGIFLLVTEDNHLARAFYQHLGYTLVGSLEGYVRRERTECIYFKTVGSRLND